MSRQAVPLEAGWQLARTREGPWHPAEVPGTVASNLHADLDTPGPYDAEDWWYRAAFAAAPANGGRQYLRFDGLATLAHVWLNGEPILESRNMFLAHRVDVTGRLRDVNQLVIRFEPLAAALAQKRPRPRWRTALVDQQNLRWFRTTLLGRIPGWTPAIAPVGPWRAISLETIERVEVTSLNLQARAEGTIGRVQVRAAAARLDGHPVEGARLRLGELVYPLRILHGHDARIHGDIEVEDAPLWWPHTHGEPRRVPWALELLVDGRWLAGDGGMLGFKEIALDTHGGGLRFRVNGVPVFCRGACWTPLDILRLRADRPKLRAALEALRDGGANMLRIGGTMTYESEDFYELCDELGILVWQDFMFANMDYPVGDVQFRAGIEAEARQQLDRLHRHPCVAAYCGGSEVAQQAAMMGLPAERWSNEFFTDALPRLCAGLHAAIPYFPSSPWGGALPFHVGTGVAHYYGVGAYRRPLSDLKTARVKFAAECLGFANVPEPSTIGDWLGTAAPAPHHPRWKARVPRDNGAGYDFEDVRDHYLEELFGRDAVALRSRDLDRYYRLSRVVSGEVMRRAFAEWRSPASGCGGALVWFLRDLWPGAGWGIVASDGRPKAAYWYLRRAWAKRSIHLTDEGLDGFALHAVNDTAESLDGTIEIEMYGGGRTLTASAKAPLAIPAHSTLSQQVDALLGYFTDATNAYRFGPPKQDVVLARLRGAAGEVVAEDFFFPAGLDLPEHRQAAVSASAEPLSDGRVAVTLRSDVFLQSVSVACEGWMPEDDHFHVAPNNPRRLAFTPLAAGSPFGAEFTALNLRESIGARTDGMAAAQHPGTTAA